jgi:hypothetical protein
MKYRSLNRENGGNTPRDGSAQLMSGWVNVVWTAACGATM